MLWQAFTERVIFNIQSVGQVINLKQRTKTFSVWRQTAYRNTTQSTAEMRTDVAWQPSGTSTFNDTSPN